MVQTEIFAAHIVLQAARPLHTVSELQAGIRRESRAFHQQRGDAEKHLNDNTHSELGSAFRKAWITSGNSDFTMYR